MKTNYDEAQIEQAVSLGLIPRDTWFPITNRLVEQTALLKITDWELFNSKTKGTQNSVLRLFFKTAALNLLKYRSTFSSKGKEGFVYLMQDSERPEYIKLGKSKEPERRLSEANCFSPNKSFKMLRVFFYEDALAVEAELHRKYSEYCTSGEWFRSINLPEVIEYLSGKTYNALLAQLDRAT
ncbi:hypothetical protein My1_076 [Pectobacterium phage My1]|uniref:Bacteriophage T5 Orf172 DNA-binding domain-containing protein n=1 Tax=Pectobacterium phage My1 TaxID=1204539 RepID=J9QGR2_9CAUD|nr:hypothetical protein My1_076 [Pectobacterium phage My1]AFQ22235.1 hypothetical protein My1_076 [Pectobacterium phage My1]